MMDVRALFDRRGLRCTRQRERIYRALAATTAHPTAEELHRIVQRAGARISIATVYNTLEAFTRRGLARRFSPMPGDAPSAAERGGGAGLGACRYDADTSEHAHFVGEDGRIRDLPGDLDRRLMDELPRDLIDEIERRMGVQVERVSVKLVGRQTGRGSAC